MIPVQRLNRYNYNSRFANNRLNHDTLIFLQGTGSILLGFVFMFLQIIPLPKLKEVRGQQTKYYLRNDYG